MEVGSKFHLDPERRRSMFALPKAALPLFRSVAGACVLPTASDCSL